MSILDIHVLGSPVLRQETMPIGEVTGELRQLIADMFETMYAANGIGLAAPQVGRTERIAVVDVDDEQIVLINPEIILEEGSAKAEEGCLSIPDVYGDVQRAARVIVRALDREGKPFEREAIELLARCFQHEIDHLHGRLFIDHLSVIRRKASLAKWATVKGRYQRYLRKLSTEEVAEHHHRGEEL